MVEWLPKYNFSLFKYDLLAGITIASLAIPQGISDAKLANIPPIIGMFRTVAAFSLIIAASIEEKVSSVQDLDLYVSLVFTTCLISALIQTALGALRLGILVDFLSHSTILGFMGGTTVFICLQQLKGMLGTKHFTTHTDMVSVLRSVFSNRKKWV